jgi:hypothetical protein
MLKDVRSELERNLKNAVKQNGDALKRLAGTDD